MPERQLHEMLVKLEQALEQGAEIEDDDRALLLKVKGDLERVLSPDEESPQEPQALVASALDRFGSKHPELANILSNALDALGRIGV